jgi:hypothetical protein
MKMRRVIILFALLFLIASSLPAGAALSVRDEWVGNYAISSDGWGGTDQNGVISAAIPDGATVVAAYLYSATYGSQATVADVSFDSNTISFSETWTTDIFTNDAWFHTGISDVTNIVQDKYNANTALGIYNFDLRETSAATDGEALVVVYQMASLPTATVAVMDGPQELAGQDGTR